MRRIFAVLIVVLFAAAVLCIPIIAQGTVYFTAINNTLLALEDKTMPVKQKSVIYVPCSVFNSNELGTYAMYFRSKQLVMISDLEHTLYFDMRAGTSYDDSDETFPYAAIYQNDTAYVPTFFVADYFAMRYTLIRNDYATIVRVTKGDVLSDEAFLRGATAIMETRLAQYRASQETPPPATVSPAVPTAKPTAKPAPTPSPTPTPVPLPTPSPTQKPNRSSVYVYVAFLGLGESSEENAELLLECGYSPCFFVGAEDIRSHPDMIRKLRGIGCGIGILFETDLEREYEEASGLLREAAHMRTFLTACPVPLPEDPEHEPDHRDVIVWCAKEPETTAPEVIKRLDRAVDRCDLVLDGGIGLAELRVLTDHLQTYSYSVGQITELTAA